VILRELHWNGRTWNQVAVPGSNLAGLNGVSARSPTNAWAVGFYAGDRPLRIRWNGTTWKRVLN
jgi:hypothetical protein